MTESQLLKVYQRRALDTAQPEAFQLEYLVPGIVGEIGELFGHRAKAVWHGTPEEELKVKLAGEYGDIGWMTAVLLSTHQISEVDLDFAAQFEEERDAWYGLLSASHTLYDAYTYHAEDLYDIASALWAYLQLNSEKIVGLPFDEVLKGNLEKLASRAERGVLRGAGDNR